MGLGSKEAPITSLQVTLKYQDDNCIRNKDVKLLYGDKDIYD